MPVKFSCVGVLCILSFQTIQETTGGFTFFYPVDLSWEQMRFFFYLHWTGHYYGKSCPFVPTQYTTRFSLPKINVHLFWNRKIKFLWNKKS